MVAVPSVAEAPDVDPAQVSKKALASPAGATAGTIGKGMMIRAEHGFANDDLFHSYNSDICATSFLKPGTVILFVQEFLNFFNVKIKEALQRVHAETINHQDQIKSSTKMGPTVKPTPPRCATAFGAPDCVKRGGDAVLTPGSTRQAAGVLKTPINVEIVYPRMTVNRVVNISETIESAVTGALGTKNSFIRDCYYKCNGRIWQGNDVIILSNICEGSRLLVCPRLRGRQEAGDTGSGASSPDLSKLGKISLTDKIAATKDWLEAVDVPASLRWPSDPESVLMLGEGGRMILTQLLQCIERLHSFGKSLQGKFEEKDIFFLPLYDVLEIDSVWHELDAEGYRSDLEAIIPILKKHFVEDSAARVTRYPMLVENLIAEIRMLKSEETLDYKDFDRRSIIFSHPVMQCSSARISIYTNIILHSSSSCGTYEQNFRDALDPPGSIKFPAPNWVLRAYDTHDQSSPEGLRDVFVHPEKAYRNTFLSRLRFSRCLVTHALKNEITEKQVEAALYLLWPTQLPELQRRVMLLFKPTARSKSANKDSTAVKTVNLIDLREIFGSKK